MKNDPQKELEKQRMIRGRGARGERFSIFETILQPKISESNGKIESIVLLNCFLYLHMNQQHQVYNSATTNIISSVVIICRKDSILPKGKNENKKPNWKKRVGPVLLHL